MVTKPIHTAANGKNSHHRKSIQLKGYDYAQAGWYFITICCQNHAILFGKIVGAKYFSPRQPDTATEAKIVSKNRLARMMLNAAGKTVRQCWLEIPVHFPNVVLHEFVIMPNHIHGIIEIVGAKNILPSPIVINNNEAKNILPLRGTSKTIGSVVRGFKIGVTKWMRQNTPTYSVWQRNYYEHIIRDELSYQNISRYILHNPANWANDKFYVDPNGDTF
jgi:putative transposase